MNVDFLVLVFAIFIFFSIPRVDVIEILKSLHISYEHAVGYTLFIVKQVEGLGSLQPEVEKSALDFNRFNSIVSLVAFSLSESAVNAFDNVLSFSEGVMFLDLRAFLEGNLPSAPSDASKKKKKK